MTLLSCVLVASHALAAPVASQAPDGPPVRIWLGSGLPLASGDQERVYIQTSTDGHLVVLHARPDGRVEVLFPEDPASDPFVRAGTYEIRTPVSSGPGGRGMLVAALSPDPIWFDEFVHRSTWDAASLTGAGTGDDPEALLTGIVQRMLGDGSFNYDLVTYTVTPRPAAIVDAAAAVPQAPSECVECSVTQVDLVVSDLPLRHFSPHHRRGTAAPAVTPAPPTPAAIAVYSAHRSLEPLPLVARARSAAAQGTEMPRSQLLTRVVHVARSPRPDLIPTNGPARAWVAAVSAPATASSTPAPAGAPAPVAAPEPRVVARPDARAGVARAGTTEAAPAAARTGSVTGVGLGQVHTAGWRH